jgi:hypothetical protein
VSVEALFENIAQELDKIAKAPTKTRPLPKPEPKHGELELLIEREHARAAKT